MTQTPTLTNTRYNDLTPADRAWAEPLLRIDDKEDGDQEFGVKREGRSTSSLLLENLNVFGEQRIQCFVTTSETEEITSFLGYGRCYRVRCGEIGIRFESTCGSKFLCRFVDTVLNILIRLDKQTLRNFRPEMLQKMT